MKTVTIRNIYRKCVDTTDHLPVRLPRVKNSDDPVFEAFTCGHCHSLAIALNRLTGWPLVGFGYESHVAVLRPDGQILDIAGVSSIKKVEQAFGAYRGKIDLKSFTKEYYKPQMQAAMPFARLLLEKYGKVV